MAGAPADDGAARCVSMGEVGPYQKGINVDRIELVWK